MQIDTDEGLNHGRQNNKIIYHGSHYEIKIESRSGITVIVGKSEYGNFACIPDWSAGCYLSSLRDTFWNQERLIDAIGTVDGITVLKLI
jgi:hypothetical protein